MDNFKLDIQIKWLKQKLHDIDVDVFFNNIITYYDKENKKEYQLGLRFKKYYLIVINPSWNDEDVQAWKRWRKKTKGQKAKIQFKSDESFDKKIDFIYSALANEERKHSKKEKKAQFKKKKIKQCQNEDCNVKYNIHIFCENNKTIGLCTKCYNDHQANRWKNLTS